MKSKPLHIPSSAHFKQKLRGKTKAQKIRFLERSAAAKARHHKAHIRRHARLHTLVFLLLAVAILGFASTLFARAYDLVPPPSARIDIERFKVEAEAARPPTVKPPDQVGIASWYALGLRSPDALTCASTKFPRGTYLEVTDLRNGRKVTCLVNDYGPQQRTGRVIDLSRGSYKQLEGLGSGTLPAEIRVVPAPQ